jgi:8-oxo-dGTP diphosphatase
MDSPVAPDKRCPHCGRYNNRGLTIDAVIVRDSRILLGKRGGADAPFKGYWALPGGYVEWGESTETALAREVREETGLTVTGQAVIGVYSDPHRTTSQAVTVGYAAQTTGEPTAGDDLAEVEWFPLDKLPSELAFDHADIIADYRKTR